MNFFSKCENSASLLICKIALWLPPELFKPVKDKQAKCLRPDESASHPHSHWLFLFKVNSINTDNGMVRFVIQVRLIDDERVL